jgi:anaphase-promoting complex subunit 5
MKEHISNHGSQMLLQSTLYSRLGVPHLANVHCDLLLHCYEHSCPVDEKIRATGRQAFMVSDAQICRVFDHMLKLLLILRP